MRGAGVLLACVFSSLLFADGGMVLQRAEKGPLAITVFATQAPLDLSVLVQNRETLEPVLDADVRVTLTHGESRVAIRATHDQAQNKLLYVASAKPNEPGEWRYAVSVGNAEISGVVHVASEQPKLAAYWSYLALPFPLIAIFMLHQWLQSRPKNAFQRAQTGLLAHHD
ncbi:MAG TPA: hypothetical protein VG273_07545 [Bryobacteraceae bacterium]|nr:hypothetical protein [Bryobacteraceae bacterium]